MIAAVLAAAQAQPNTPIHVNAGVMTPRLIELLAAERSDFAFTDSEEEARAQVLVIREQEQLSLVLDVDGELVLERRIDIEGDRIDAALRVAALLIVDQVSIARQVLALPDPVATTTLAAAVLTATTATIAAALTPPDPAPPDPVLTPALEAPRLTVSLAVAAATWERSLKLQPGLALALHYRAGDTAVGLHASAFGWVGGSLIEPQFEREAPVVVAVLADGRRRLVDLGPFGAGVFGAAGADWVRATLQVKSSTGRGEPRRESALEGVLRLGAFLESDRLARRFRVHAAVAGEVRLGRLRVEVESLDPSPDFDRGAAAVFLELGAGADIF